jgi:hypothetical protein
MFLYRARFGPGSALQKMRGSSSPADRLSARELDERATIDERPSQL